MDGKSVMGLLLLAAARGSTMTISAEGQRRARGGDGPGGAGRSGIWRRRGRSERGHGDSAVMTRLTGIGVSPGVVSGRAVILIQRAQVLRYQLAPGRIEQELARLDQSRARAREQLVDIRARVVRLRGPEVGLALRRAVVDAGRPDGRPPRRGAGARAARQR